MAKKDMSGGSGSDNVVEFPNPHKLAGGHHPNYYSGKHWSALKIDLLEIDLSANPDDAMVEHFEWQGNSFRVVYDDDLAMMGAKAFFGLAGFGGLPYLTDERPPFDPVLAEFEMHGRAFVVGAIAGVVHFYSQISPEHGLMLQVQFPSSI